MNAEQLAYFKHRLQEMEGEVAAERRPDNRAFAESSSFLTLPIGRRSRKNTLGVAHTGSRTQVLKKSAASTRSNWAVITVTGEETGEPIGFRACWPAHGDAFTRAQQRRELKQKMFGD